MLTQGLVAALLKRKEYEPPGVAELLVAHETATSFGHDLADLSTQVLLRALDLAISFWNMTSCRSLDNS